MTTAQALTTVTVVGASLAGLHAARGLRSLGYDGRLVVVGEERHRPYDRPPLSKEFLTGDGDPGDGPGRLALTDPEEEAELDAEWLLGIRAEALDTAAGQIRLTGGRALRTDGVVIATGATPRTLPLPRLDGVHTLRTLDDATRLRAALRAGAARVVVIGAGFIGAEVASSCAALGLDVTVVEAAPLPLVPQLGEEMARVCAGLHARGGATLLCGAGVEGLRGSGRVTGVELTDGRVLPADVVVVGVGVRPVTGWLEGSGLALDDGVRCDAGCVTALPNVVAVGDVARLARPGTARTVRAEHWTSGMLQGAVAARNLLAGSTVEPFEALPYFWSDQYGARIQYAGRRAPGDTVRIAEGDPADGGGFLAVYERDGITTAVLGVDRPRPFMRLRRELSRAPQPAGR
ncbi:NAD(P)/FAD-dependent oxidoreductase [Streptomyces sp. 4503]|uniref:NAD(P)/FAD-dependent oxidoreductase n=1 Tax=Streptomyces niphimycinicus TaxID=2842201 RepID=A0ABS6CJI5_9ACTN|nr:FAD/NAD(P)-binding oxidoreductase [Streptomyces niphimycinicus]MBU3867080.1 NAD(P)/FAD-dependent oxidoreductase [Streptomyces niphimycinicus]